jgi:ABC-2 type transport system permease protein
MTTSIPMMAVREAQAELRKVLRSPAYLVPSFAFPLVFFSLVGLVMAPTGAARAVALATIGVFASLGPTLFGIASDVAAEREHGLLALQRVSPAPLWIHPLAKLTTATAISCGALACTYVLAAVSGVRLPASGWVELVLVHLGAVVPFGLLGLLLGHLTRGQGAVAIANILLLVFGILGGLWIPLRLLPVWAREVAPLTPAYHLGQLALDAVGRVPAMSVPVHLATISAWIVLPAVALAVLLRRDQG